MIRRKTWPRRKPKKRLARNPFKPVYETRREKKRKEYRAKRPGVRERVFHRDGGRCRCPCRKTLRLAAYNPFQVAHANEIRRRSQLGDPLDLTNVITLAPECHEKVTHNELQIEVGDASLGANGRVFFTGELASGRYVEHAPSDPLRLDS